MDALVQILSTIWGRFVYIATQPLQDFSQWAFQHPAYYLLFPEFFLALAILGIVVVWVFSRGENLNVVLWLGIIGSASNFAMTIHLMFNTSRYFNYGLGTFWGGLETIDPFALFFKQLMDWGDIMLFLVLMGYGLMKKYRVEFILFTLMATVAFDLMVGSSDLLAIYVMTEFASILLYVMAAWYKDDLRSLEAGLKLFITGVVSSAALLFGIAIIYGLTGSTNLYDLKLFLELGVRTYHPMVVLAFVMIVVGIGYKVGVAPFHLWIPDTYEGAPTPVTAFLSVYPKIAGFAVFIRLFLLGFIPVKEAWVPLVATIAIITLFLGNIMALRQTSFKRLMAYSGIAQMGYVLLGIIGATYAFEPTSNIAFYATLYYLMFYFFANLGAFLIAMLNEISGGSDELVSYNGFWKRSPALSAFMTIFLLALTGIPPTVGFIGKFLIFLSLFMFFSPADPLPLILIIVGVINAVIAAFYYLGIVRRIYLEVPSTEQQGTTFVPFLFQRLAVAFPALAVLMLGFIFVQGPYEYVRGAWFLTYWITLA